MERLVIATKNYCIITEDTIKCLVILYKLNYIKEIKEEKNSFIIRLIENHIPELIFALKDERVRIKRIYQYVRNNKY
jgi:hypothetical protein